jgi:hypothetical protein
MLLGSNNYRDWKNKRGRCEVERLDAHTHTHRGLHLILVNVVVWTLMVKNNWNFYETPINEDIRTRTTITSLDFFSHMNRSNLNIFLFFCNHLLAIYVTKKNLFCKSYKSSINNVHHKVFGHHVITSFQEQIESSLFLYLSFCPRANWSQKDRQINLGHQEQ